MHFYSPGGVGGPDGLKAGLMHGCPTGSQYPSSAAVGEPGPQQCVPAGQHLKNTPEPQGRSHTGFADAVDEATTDDEGTAGDAEGATEAEGAADAEATADPAEDPLEDPAGADTEVDRATPASSVEGERLQPAPMARPATITPKKGGPERWNTMLPAMVARAPSLAVTAADNRVTAATSSVPRPPREGPASVAPCPRG